MTSRIPENSSTWLVDWSLVTIMGNTMPPRDPNDNADEEEVTTARTKTNPTNRRSCANRTTSSTACCARLYTEEDRRSEPGPAQSFLPTQQRDV